MNETTDASALFAPIWRRKWLILAVAILVAVGTYLYYRHQAPDYQATTEVYLAAGAEEEITISGVPAATGRKGSGLEPSAQAVLINSPIIRTTVRDQLKREHKTKAVRAALRGKVKAKAAEKTEFITITSEARSKHGAVLLADLTAQTYVRRQNTRYRREIEGAITITRREIHRINVSQEADAEATQPPKGSKSTSTGTSTSSKGKSSTVASSALQLANLSSKLNQLEGNLGIDSVRQVSQATPQNLSTSPKRNAIFGFLVGLLLASLLAYVLARLDPRLRTLSEIEGAFQIEILTALPAVRRPIVLGEGEPRPSRYLYEPLGRLQTSLQIAAVGRDNGQPSRPKTVLFTSADSGNGQSTVIAGLALVARHAQGSVAVVEADLRRPSLAGLLGVGDRPGLADVLAGRLALGEAIQTVGIAPLLEPDAGDASVTATQLAVHAPPASVSVLVGAPVENPSTLLAGGVMAETLRALAADHDHVLIDAPPPLEVGDAIPLLSLADAVVVVARAGQTREAAARRLMQLLRRTTDAPVLGVVANGVSAKDSRRYGFSTYRPRSRWGRLGGR